MLLKLLRRLTLAIVSPEFKTSWGQKRNATTPLYNKLVGRLSNENTVFTTVYGDEQSKFVYTKIDKKAYRVNNGSVLPAIHHLGR